MTEPQAARETPDNEPLSIGLRKVAALAGQAARETHPDFAHCSCRTMKQHDAERQAARETLRPDPLTLREAAQAVLDELDIVPDDQRAYGLRVHPLTHDALRAAFDAVTPDPAEPRNVVWWCGQWGTLNAKRYHGNSGPCPAGNCGEVAYTRLTPDRAASTVEPGLREALDDIRSFVAEEPAREGAGLHFAISQVRVLDYIDSRLAALTPDETA